MASKLEALDQEVKQLSEANRKIDLDARREFIAALVKCGAELPATAWEGDAKDRKPAAHLASMPLDALRARVKALAAARPPQGGPRPPTETIVELSDFEKSVTAGMTPAQLSKYQERRARRSA